jgi:fucose 4-O-acetylase-like acetyltransferase
VSISFSIAVFYVAKFAFSESGEWTRKILRILGTNTLEIYVSHYYFVQIYPRPWIDARLINVIPLFVLVFLISIPVSLFIVKVACVFKKVPGLALLLFGQYRHSDRSAKADV